jgi:hypothetical protein
MVFTFFLTVAESVTEKALGSGKLRGMETNFIQWILSDFDREYLDPVVTKLLEAISPFEHELQTIHQPVIPQQLTQYLMTVIK